MRQILDNRASAVILIAAICVVYFVATLTYHVALNVWGVFF